MCITRILMWLMVTLFSSIHSGAGLELLAMTSNPGWRCLSGSPRCNCPHTSPIRGVGEIIIDEYQETQKTHLCALRNPTCQLLEREDRTLMTDGLSPPCEEVSQPIYQVEINPD